jgi:hypothetical protein
LIKKGEASQADEDLAEDHDPYRRATQSREEMLVAKFITIGYGDESGYERTSSDLRDAAHAHDAMLVSRHAIVGVAGVPIQVRNHQDSGVQTQDGPYLKSDLPVAGFALIEAASLDEAVDLVAKTPCAIADGVVEVWPLLGVPD